MWVQRLQQSKIVISLLIAVLLVFSYEVNKPKAVAPLVAWGGSVVATLVLEEAAEMGIKWVSKDLAKKKANEIAAQAWKNGNNDLDFPLTKPIQKADGSVIVKPSAKDRGKIASLIAIMFGDELFDAMDDDAEYTQMGGDIYIYPYDSSLVDNVRMVDLISSMYMYTKRTGLDPSYPDRVMPTLVSKVTGNMTGMFGNYIKPEIMNTVYLQPMMQLVPNATSADGRSKTGIGAPGTSETNIYIDASTLKAYWKMFGAEQFGTTVHMTDDGFMIPQTINNVYNYPTTVKMPDTYKIPNEVELTNKPLVIKNLMPALPAGSSDKEIEWTDIENNYTDDSSVRSKIEIDAQTYLENGNVYNTTNNYTQNVVNNYYTDINKDIKVIDVEEDTKTWTSTPVVPGDDDDLPTGTRPDPVEVIDRSMLDVARQSYDYLGDSVDTAISSMRDVTDNVTGLIAFLDDTFDWLPAEWRALFGSAFILGVFAHFFRR